MAKKTFGARIKGNIKQRHKQRKQRIAKLKPWPKTITSGGLKYDTRISMTNSKRKAFKDRAEAVKWKNQGIVKRVTMQNSLSRKQKFAVYVKK